jgi:hypothetical protein
MSNPPGADCPFYPAGRRATSRPPDALPALGRCAVNKDGIPKRRVALRLAIFSIGGWSLKERFFDHFPLLHLGDRCWEVAPSGNGFCPFSFSQCSKSPGLGCKGRVPAACLAAPVPAHRHQCAAGLGTGGTLGSASRLTCLRQPQSALGGLTPARRSAIP